MDLLLKPAVLEPVSLSRQYLKQHAPTSRDVFCVDA